MIKFKDSKGRESHTLGFAVLTWIVGTAAFLYKLPTEQAFTLLDYGSFVATAVGPFVVREWIKHQKEEQNDYGPD